MDNDMSLVCTLLKALSACDQVLAETVLSKWTPGASELLETFSFEAQSGLWSTFASFRFPYVESRPALLQSLMRPGSGEHVFYLKSKLYGWCHA